MTWLWIVLVVLVIGLAVAGWIIWQRQRTDGLKERFGPEYDRTVAEADKRREGERELLEREERHDKLDIRPLSAEAREEFQEKWQAVQAQFVDDAAGAVHDADALVGRVMSDRGYPRVDDPAARADELSVEHAGVVGEYRRGHELLQGLDGSEDKTETLRESMQCFRKAFEELLDDREVVRAYRRGRARHEPDPRRRRGRGRPSTAQLAVQGARDDEGAAGVDGGGGERQPLFSSEDADSFRDRWQEIQGKFVDDPRRAVEQGDSLVATLMQQLAETFADERTKLERQWDKEGDASTEDLRIALQRYRSFFDRLLQA
jgi:hypothetical protein